MFGSKDRVGSPGYEVWIIPIRVDSLGSTIRVDRLSEWIDYPRCDTNTLVLGPDVGTLFRGPNGCVSFRGPEGYTWVCDRVGTPVSSVRMSDCLRSLVGWTPDIMVWMGTWDGRPDES